MTKNGFSVPRTLAALILKHQSPEQKLDSLEEESRNILDLQPEYGRRYILSSFRRKHIDDTQRAP